MEDMKKFRELGLSEVILEALAKKGFEEPSPIQSATIPLLLKGDTDLVGQAQTGTGKTAAFGLPILERLQPRTGFVQALILAPTRELAVQVAEELNSLKGKKKLDILPVYGGQSMEQQLKRLKRGVDIVVGTPGRVQDHINRKSLKLENLKYMILDEADEMLNMGFVEDVENIMKSTPEDRITLLFSATMPNEILRIAKRYMKGYELIAVKKQELTTDLTEQKYFQVAERDKFEALCRIIDVEKEFYGIVFCRTKRDVDQVSSHLGDRGYEADAIHGDISQSQRESVLRKFKTKRTNILVATDVAARGIDVNDLTHVINYALPQDPESYVHRIGRTGRAGKQGTAITFVTGAERRKLMFIERFAKTEIKKEQLPDVSEVLKRKTDRIVDEVSQCIIDDSFSNYLDLSKQLLEGKDAQAVLAAVLKYSLKDELNKESYVNIRESKAKAVGNGKQRLFIALGKIDKMNPRKLVEMLCEDTGLGQNDIKDVKVLEKFSFATVTEDASDLIVDVFKRKKRRGRPIIEKAKSR